VTASDAGPDTDPGIDTGIGRNIGPNVNMQTILRRQIVAVWRAAVQARVNQGRTWTTWLPVLGVELLAIGTWWVKFKTAGVASMALWLSLNSSIGIFMLWVPFVYNVLQQNTPASAKLVPGHLPALRWALCIVAAVCIALISGVAGLAGAIGVQLTWVVTGMSAALALSASFVRWRKALLVVPLFSLAAPLVVDGPAVGWALAILQAHALWIAPGVVLLSVLALCTTVLQGGPRHHRSQTQLAALAAAMRGQNLVGVSRPGGIGISGAWWSGLFLVDAAAVAAWGPSKPKLRLKRHRRALGAGPGAQPALDRLVGRLGGGGGAAGRLVCDRAAVSALGDWPGHFVGQHAVHPDLRADLCVASACVALGQPA
jgi:hypothetical protein